jgi:hypothetical protein
LTVNQNLLRDLIKFLVSNQHIILMPADQARRVLTTRSLAQTPMGAVFSKAIETGKDQMVSLLNIPTTVRDAPEVVSFQHITFDVPQMKSFVGPIADALATTPFADKIIINATPWLTRHGEVMDLLAIQATVVRGLLSRSYFTAKGRTWISPSVIRLVGKLYSMSIGGAVANQYNLSAAEHQSVVTLFAYHFLRLCTRDYGEAEAMLVAHARHFGISRVVDIAAIADLYRASATALVKASDGPTLDVPCAAAATGLGVPRLESFSARVLMSRLRTLGPDVHTTALAMDYPPYWVYLTLLAMSGRKTGLTFVMKKMGYDKDVIKNLAPALNSAPEFLSL